MKKNVLFIIWSFTYGGGAEKILANIVNNLDSKKYNIEILEYCHSDIGSEKVNQNIIVHKPIIDETKKGIYYRIKNNIIIPGLNKYVPSLTRKLFLNKTYDIEISFNYLIPTFLLNRKSKKLISWMHGSIEDLNDSPKLKKKQKKYLDRVDKIIPISENTEKSILHLYPEYVGKIMRIYNGYDFNKMKKLVMAGKEVDEFDLLFCARLDENKNPVMFIDIVNLIVKKGRNITAYILGTGVLQEQIEKRINAYGLSDNIKLLGYVQNPYPYFEKCKVYCMTSYMEGFPTVLVEAMNFGKPFVTTPVSGSKELSNDNRCGFIANNVEEYADSVLRLLDNDYVYESMSKICMTYVKNYSLERQISNIEKLLDE